MEPQRLRVVLADDTSDIRALLRAALDLDGRFDVVGEAEDGEEALAMVAAERPDAVVLDLAMPVMDGLQTIPQIRRRLPETKILVLSGFDATRISRDACELGADAYLEKGTALADVASVLLRLCGASPSLVVNGLRTPLARGCALAAPLERSTSS
jgi:DNA-binding NarL/FixJ family response regulator